MTQDVLEQILAIRGVTRAALVDGVGETVLVAPQGLDEGLAAGLITSSLATSRVLADLLGEGDLCQAMIDFENGPILLAPLLPVSATVDAMNTANVTDDSQPGTATPKPTNADTHVAVLTLDAASALGRVRLGLRKLLPELARALQGS